MTVQNAKKPKAQRAETSKHKTPECGTKGKVTISVPFTDAMEGYSARHVDLQLTACQSDTLKRVYSAVQGMQLANGRYIQNGADVVRFLLDSIADGIAAAEK